MPFNPAKVKALRDESRRRGELLSPRPISPVGLGVSGGEVVGGSGGGLDFLLTPGGGAASMVGSLEDSVEEMFSEEATMVDKKNLVKEDDGLGRLIFPLCSGEVGLDKQWTWNLCGGLIGGARGTRFCTKSVEGTGLTHCKVASHVIHKAELQEGHGYIPSVNDRANTESAYLDPWVSSACFPNKINDLAGQALLHDEWIAFLTYLPTEEDMQESSYVGQEMAAEALEKSKLLVSFAVTPARIKPKLTNLITKALKSKSTMRLEPRFNEEDDSMDKMELSFENLGAPDAQEGMDAEANSAFSPSRAQWHSLVRRVETLTSELGTAREAILVMAEVSEERLEIVDGQVTNLRG
jgi:hypothetical protein